LIGKISAMVVAVAVTGGCRAILCSAAEVTGKVADRSGAAVPGVAVSVKNQAGTTVGSAISDSAGNYAIHDLGAGTYTFVVKGQTAVAYVADDGLTVDWGVAPDAPAIAVARRGAGKDGNRGDPAVAPGSTKK
jgi:Carboxypeptidase regulatory-like domain